MGCGGSREKEVGVNASLNHRMEHIGIDSIDRVFQNASPVIRELEELREIIIDRRDDVIIATGASSYTEPSIYRCMISLLWKLSADNDGDISKAEMEVIEDPPYLACRGKKNSAEGTNAAKLLIRYCNDLMTLPEKMNSLNEKMQRLGEEVLDQAGQYGEAVQEAGKTQPFKLAQMVSKLSKNIANVKAATTVCPEIAKELSSTIMQSKDIGNLLKDTEKLNEISEIGKKANKDRKVHAYDISWHYLPQGEKYGSGPMDGYNLFLGRKKNKNADKADKKLI
jgi:hypothetical protein